MCFIRKSALQVNKFECHSVLEMAAYQGMKPTLQFTNFPPPPQERRRRRRKPVKTPDVPKVKSVTLRAVGGNQPVAGGSRPPARAAAGGGQPEGPDSNEEQEDGLPRPCLKWVSTLAIDKLF